MAQEIPILIVEDDNDLRNAFTEIFSGSNYLVFQANTGLDALRILDEHRINLVVTDVFTPDMDGPAFINAMRFLYNPPPYICITGESGTMVTDFMKSFSPKAVLSKPVNFPELVAAVNTHVRKSLPQNQDPYLFSDLAGVWPRKPVTGWRPFR